MQYISESFKPLMSEFPLWPRPGFVPSGHNGSSSGGRLSDWPQNEDLSFLQSADAAKSRFAFDPKKGFFFFFSFARGGKDSAQNCAIKPSLQSSSNNQKGSIWQPQVADTTKFSTHFLLINGSVMWPHVAHVPLLAVNGLSGPAGDLLGSGHASEKERQ